MSSPGLCRVDGRGRRNPLVGGGGRGWVLGIIRGARGRRAGCRVGGSGGGVAGGRSGERLFLHGQVGVQVDLGGLECSWPSQSAITEVSTPRAAVHGRGVPQTCGVTVFSAATGIAGRGGGVFGEQPCDGVAAQRSAAAGREQRVVGSPSRSRSQRAAQRRCGRSAASRVPCVPCRGNGRGPRRRDGCRRRRSRGQFGDPQPGLDGDDEQGVVTPAEPGGAVGRGEQRVDLLVGQEARPGLRRGVWGGWPAPAGSRRRVRDGAGRRSERASGSRSAGRCGCARCCRARSSRWSRNAATSGASRSASRAGRALPVRRGRRRNSSRSVSR